MHPRSVTAGTLSRNRRSRDCADWHVPEQHLTVRDKELLTRASFEFGKDEARACQDQWSTARRDLRFFCCRLGSSLLSCSLARFLDADRLRLDPFVVAASSPAAAASSLATPSPIPGVMSG